jgi:hypothetical protein
MKQKREARNAPSTSILDNTACLVAREPSLENVRPTMTRAQERLCAILAYVNNTIPNVVAEVYWQAELSAFFPLI